MTTLATKNSASVLSPERVISASLFLIPGLLLWTPNFSIAIAIILVLYSIFYCIKNRKHLVLNHIDKLVFLILSTYFFVNIPNVILDQGNFRYLDGPSKILFCIPLYVMFKRELPIISVRKPLEYGLVIGAIGAMILALIQYFYLGYPRVDGFLFSINFGYLACSLALLNLSFCSDSGRKKLLILGFVAATTAMLLTLTRGAIFAMPLLLVLMLFTSTIKLSNKKLAGIVIGCIAGISLAYHLSPAVKERTDFTIQEFKSIASGDVQTSLSTGGRFQLWYASIEAFKANPIYGLSHDEREELNQRLHQEGKVNSWVTTVSRGHAHSQYFEMLASNGIFSFVAIFAMLILPILLFIKNRSSVFAHAGIVFVAGILTFGLTEVLLQANLISVFFGVFMAFLLAATIYGTKDTSRCE